MNYYSYIQRDCLGLSEKTDVTKYDSYATLLESMDESSINKKIHLYYHQYDEYIHNYNSPTLHKTTFLYTHSNQLHHILKSIYIYDSTLNTSLQNDSYLLDMNLFNLYKQCSKKSLTSQEIHLSTFTWKEQPSFSMDPSKEQNLSYALDHLITKEKEQWDTSTLMNLFMKEFHSLHIHKTMENLTCFLYIYSASQYLYTHQQSKIQELLELLTNSLSLYFLATFIPSSL